MRALFWIVGALASAAGGAYLISRRAKQKLSGQFLDALRQGPLVVEAFDPAIIASGVRVVAYRGQVAGTPFEFAGQTDVSGTKWRFGLIWNGSRVVTDWNPLTGENEHPLKQAYDILRRRSSKKDDDLSN